MSTNDVPGASSKNADVLAAGCWAEHDDGSLVFVKGTEADQVVYEIFDVATTPVVSYSDAMPEKGFKSQFSYPPVGKSKDRWVWHDKTPFPWDRVMKFASRPRPGFAAAADVVSAAARVAESLKLRAKDLKPEGIGHMVDDEPARRGYAIMDKIARALGTLVR